MQKVVKIPVDPGVALSLPIFGVHCPPAHKGKGNRSRVQGSDCGEHSKKNFRESASEKQLILLFRG